MIRRYNKKLIWDIWLSCLYDFDLGGGMDLYMNLIARLDSNYERAENTLKRMAEHSTPVEEQINHVRYMQGLQEARLIVTQAAREVLDA